MNKKAILHYLNIYESPDEKTLSLIDECIQEVKEIAYFKATYKFFTLEHHPLKIKELDLLLDSDDLQFYFQACHQCMVIACTLGIQIDRRIKYYQHENMAKAVVMDAVSSRYLEECCDAYEKELKLEKHSFRFAPGYGDLPLHLNIPLSKALQTDKLLGMAHNSGGLFVPMKSMIGIIGLGIETQKTCLSCIRKVNCSLRKAGVRCYVND